VNGALFPAEAAAPDLRTTTKKVKRGLRSGCFGLRDVTFPKETTFKPTPKPKTGACAIGRTALDEFENGIARSTQCCCQRTLHRAGLAGLEYQVTAKAGKGCCQALEEDIWRHEA
jgi:hypothetical protein